MQHRVMIFSVSLWVLSDLYTASAVLVYVAGLWGWIKYDHVMFEGSIYGAFLLAFVGALLFFYSIYCMIRNKGVWAGGIFSLLTGILVFAQFISITFVIGTRAYG